VRSTEESPHQLAAGLADPRLHLISFADYAAERLTASPHVIIIACARSAVVDARELTGVQTATTVRPSNKFHVTREEPLWTDAAS
jgi:hypothetical protein